MDVEVSDVPVSVLVTGVEVTPGTGGFLTGESEVRGDEGSWQGKGGAQIGERGLPVRGQIEQGG